MDISSAIQSCHQLSNWINKTYVNCNEPIETLYYAANFVFTVLLESTPVQILKNFIHNAMSIEIIQKFLMLKRVQAKQLVNNIFVVIVKYNLCIYNNMCTYS